MKHFVSLIFLICGFLLHYSTAKQVNCSLVKGLALSSCVYLKQCTDTFVDYQDFGQFGSVNGSCGGANFANHKLFGYSIRNSSNYGLVFGDQISHPISIRLVKESQKWILFVPEDAFLITTGQCIAFDTVSLVSPIFSQAYECEISFWYSATPNQSLAVYLKPMVEQSKRIELWNSTFQGEITHGEWAPASIKTHSRPYMFRIVFEILAHSNCTPTSYQAIRNIEVSGPCAQPLFICPHGLRCPNGKCLAQEEICNFVDNCGDWFDEINCDPAHLVNFEQEIGQGWTISSGMQPRSAFRSLSEGPTYDHTTGLESGHFLFARALLNESTSFRIQSPKFITHEECRFRMHVMLGSSGWNIVAIQRDAQTKLEQKVPVHFVEELNSIMQWKMYEIHFKQSNRAQQFVLIFVHNISSSTYWERPYIGLDNLHFSPRCNLLKQSELEFLD